MLCMTDGRPRRDALRTATQTPQPFLHPNHGAHQRLLVGLVRPPSLPNHLLRTPGRTFPSSPVSHPTHPINPPTTHSSPNSNSPRRIRPFQKQRRHPNLWLSLRPLITAPAKGSHAPHPHGGPVWAYYAEFSHVAQLYAANGYAVLFSTSRSTGHGGTSQPYADWGNRFQTTWPWSITP
jgi:hypothetical protein